jgi:hypothetical protein
MNKNFVKELLDPSIIASYYKANPDEQKPLFGESVFGRTTTSHLDLAFLKGSKGVSATTRLSAPDANFTFITRPGLKKERAELPFFREAAQLTEDDMLMLNAVEASYGSNSVNFDNEVKRIYDDRSELIRRGKNREEMIRFQVLQSAGITLSTANDTNNAPVTYQVTYDGDGSWAANNIINITTAWENAASNPLLDIYNALDYIDQKNSVPVKLLLPNRLYRALIANPNVVKTILPQFTNTIIGIEAIQNWLNQRVGSIDILNMRDYHSVYLDEATGNAAQFLNPNRALFLPAGNVGDVVAGPTPAQLAKAQDPSLQVAEVDGFTIANYDTQKEPFLFETVISMRKMATFEGMDDVFNLNVVAP